jgi:hypothetical protein
VEIVLPTIEGREIWLRRITKLDDEQQRILHQLQLQLPERLEPLQTQKCSENSATAKRLLKDLTPFLTLLVTNMG